MQIPTVVASFAIGLIILLLAVLGVFTYIIRKRNIRDKVLATKQDRENWRLQFFCGISQAFADQGIPFHYSRNVDMGGRVLDRADYVGRSSSKSHVAYIEIRPRLGSDDLFSFYTQRLILQRLSKNQQEQEALESFSQLIIASLVWAERDNTFHVGRLSDHLSNENSDSNGDNGVRRGKELLKMLQLHQQYWDDSIKIRTRFVEQYQNFRQTQNEVWQDIAKLLKAPKGSITSDNSAA